MISLTCISESEDEVSSSKRMKYGNNVSFGCGMSLSNVLYVGHITACGHGVMCRVVWCVVWYVHVVWCGVGVVCGCVGVYGYDTPVSTGYIL